MGRRLRIERVPIILIASLFWYRYCSAYEYGEYEYYGDYDYPNCYSDFNHCQYNGDMCALDAEKCWRQMLYGECLSACDEVYDKPGAVYVERGYISYWIEIPSHERSLYPEDMTYTILRVASISSLSKEGSIEPVPGCCSIRLKESCILPNRSHPEEKFLAILPLNESSLEYEDYPSFCRYLIEERPKPDTWCTSEDDFACFYVDSEGKVKRRAFIPMNSENKRVNVLYVFSTGQELNYTIDEDEYSFHVDDLYLYNAEGLVRLPSGINKTFTARKNVSSDDVFDVEPPPNLKAEYCCFILGDEDKHGPTDATCVNVETSNEQPVFVVVIIVICCFVVAAIVVVSAIWAYEKHFKTCTYEYWLKNAPFHVKGEVLEDPSVINKLTKDASNQPEVIEVNWLEESKEHSMGFHRQQIDSGFQDYECDDVIDREVTNYVRQEAGGDSRNCDLGESRQSIDLGESSPDQDLSNGGDHSYRQLPSKSKREKSQVLLESGIERFSSPTVESGVYFSP